jgi:hypothetical protein
LAYVTVASRQCKHTKSMDFNPSNFAHGEGRLALINVICPVSFLTKEVDMGGALLSPVLTRMLSFRGLVGSIRRTPGEL